MRRATFAVTILLASAAWLDLQTGAERFQRHAVRGHASRWPCPPPSTRARRGDPCIGARGVKRRVVEIRGARAVRVEYRFDITVQTKRTVQTLQYAFMRPGRSVVVTYTTLPSLAERYAATFQRSAASIRFG